jgi:hypothetical protein
MKVISEDCNPAHHKDLIRETAAGFENRVALVVSKWV